MTIHDAARRYAREEVDSVWRQMRLNGINQKDERNWRGPARTIKKTIHDKLYRSRQYGSIELWLYVLLTLGKLIWEVIRERQNEAWGKVHG